MDNIQSLVDFLDKHLDWCHSVHNETLPVSSSPWLLSVDVLVVMSSGSLWSSYSAPSSSSGSRSLSDDRQPRAGALYTSRLE